MNIDMILTVQPYIPGIPQGKDFAWKNATRNDSVTLNSWHDTWISQNVENSKYSNGFEKNVMELYGSFAGKPVILMGSGPSLKKNWKDLIGDGKNSIGRKDIPIVTNVHNFHFCEDRELMTQNDFYCVLDAGPITIKELSDGGINTEQWYWEKTRERTLIAYTGTNPEFIRKWQGTIYWYTTPCASQELCDAIYTIVDISKVPGFNVGGNVMGAALYFSRAVLGCSVPIFIGMDLCFSYDRKFHSWNSEYDSKFSGLIPWIDIFGNRVYTWGSYFGFKSWFDFMACGGSGNNPQIFINATEGGIMGSYPEGNIQQIIQLDLKSSMNVFNMYHRLPSLVERSGDKVVESMTVLTNKLDDYTLSQLDESTLKILSEKSVKVLEKRQKQLHLLF